MTVKVSKRFRRMADLYRVFAPDTNKLDYSEDALLSLYNHESRGLPLSCNNGYAFGKQYLNLHVTMWREDIKSKLLSKQELYDDPKFANFHWWLDSIFKSDKASAKNLS